MLPVHQRLHPRRWSARGELDRGAGVPARPTRSSPSGRRPGTGLTSPEFAGAARLRQDHADRATCSRLDLPDDPWFAAALRGVLPARRCASGSATGSTSHPLRREIVTTCVVNDMVNRGGITFVFRAAEETGADRRRRSRAPTRSCREVFGLRDFVGRGRGAGQPACRPTRRPRSTSSSAGCSTGRCAGSCRPGRGRLDVAAEIERFRAGRRRARAAGARAAASAPSASGCERGRAELVELGRARRARRRARPALLDAFSLLDIVEIAHDDRDAPRARSRRVYFVLSERFERRPRC